MLMALYRSSGECTGQHQSRCEHRVLDLAEDSSKYDYPKTAADFEVSKTRRKALGSLILFGRSVASGLGKLVTETVVLLLLLLGLLLEDVCLAYGDK